jgi:hypothetical protein
MAVTDARREGIVVILYNGVIDGDGYLQGKGNACRQSHVNRSMDDIRLDQERIDGAESLTSIPPHKVRANRGSYRS